MAVFIINSSNRAEHVLIQGPGGQRDDITVHPGQRAPLPEGWSVVDTGITLRHLAILDPEKEAAKRVADAKAQEKS